MWNVCLTDPPVSVRASNPPITCESFFSDESGIWDVEAGLILRTSTVSDCKRKFSSSLDSWWKCSLCDLHFCSRSRTLTFDGRRRKQRGPVMAEKRKREREREQKIKSETWGILHTQSMECTPSHVMLRYELSEEEPTLHPLMLIKQPIRKASLKRHFSAYGSMLYWNHCSLIKTCGVICTAAAADTQRCSTVITKPEHCKELRGLKLTV